MIDGSGSAKPSDVEEVKRVVGEFTDQTQAVEDSVQQVMSLRS